MNDRERGMRSPGAAVSALGGPFLAGTALLVLAPAVVTMALAFTEATGFSSPRFVGFDGFGDLFADPRFRRATAGTVVFAVISVGMRMLAVVGLTLLLARPGLTTAAVRTAVFIPSVLPDTAVALVWLWLLDPISGPIASLAALAGAGPLPLLVSAGPARITVPLVAATRVGEAFVVALAARRALPARFLEVAVVEGASPWFVTRRIVLPLLAPVLGLLAVRDLVAALGGGLGPALILTRGGPAGATTYLPQYVREEGFAALRFGTAAAVGTLTLVFALAMAAAATPVLRRSFRRVG